MRRKDYLRGLGMGILVTVLILTIAGGGEMTDAQVRARAMELGMVDGQNTTLDEVREQTSEQNTEEESRSESSEAEPLQESSEEESAPESSTSEAASETEEATTEAEVAQPVTITVVRGDSSVSVSRDLAAAGMVESAKDFDAYLCSNGYDKRISVGTFTIQPGSTYEEIAKIITKSK